MNTLKKNLENSEQISKELVNNQQRKKKMFEFCSLYSGSSGNSLFVQTSNTKILVDAGESAKKIAEALSLIGMNADELDAILVTHEHLDHVKGLRYTF